MAAFQSLYRKHRPQSFGELVGQESVSTALRNAVREGRVGHAYLFSGPRGTGKTSTARVLAKALNCRARRDDGEPCNACVSCTEITSGTSMDVVELDAASNRGVNEMRSLLERVAYRSAGGDWKVYIVDEVHMLTKEASTALLKTLEEPPGHVVFVLATTDPQMVLPTIRSRTQHFEFSLLPADRLAEHLGDVARREGVESDPETLGLLARRAGGSARDALSLLDQALAYGDGKLVPEQVATLLGGTAFAARTAILDAVAAGDVGELLERLDTLLGGGVDARQLADDLLRHLRDVFLLSSSRGRVRVEAPEEERARLAAQGEALGLPAVVRAMETLGEAALEIRRAPDPRLVLEVALVRLSRREAGGAAALAERVERLERAVDELRRALAGTGAPPPAPSGPATSPPAPSGPATSPPAPSGPAPARARAASGPGAALGALRSRGAGSPTAEGSPPAPPPSPDPPGAPAARPRGPSPAPEDAGPADRPPAEAAVPAGGEAVDLADAVTAWPRALSAFRPRLRAMAMEAQPVRVEGSVVVLGLPARFEQFHLPTIRGEAEAVATALSAELGRPVRIRVVLDDSRPAADGAGPGGDAAEAEALAAEIGEPRPPAGQGGVDSPVGLVIETFGATIESEIVRE